MILSVVLFTYPEVWFLFNDILVILFPVFYVS